MDGFFVMLGLALIADGLYKIAKALDALSRSEKPHGG